MRRPSFREADLAKAASGLRKAGYGIAKIEIDPTGKIVIIPGQAERVGKAGEWADLEQ
jgi:hypothetical protein